MRFYITGTRRGLGRALEAKYGNSQSIDDCDIFINCKHDEFMQVNLLYEAAEKKKRIINIGSVASDWTKGINKTFKYAVYKKALCDANDQLFYEGVETTIINFGYLDTESQSHVDQNKIDLDYAIYIVDWILQQPHRIKEISLIPSGT